MARRRKMTALQRKYFGKRRKRRVRRSTAITRHRRKAPSMAKRRRRRHHGGGRRRARRRHHGGGHGGITGGIKGDMPVIVAAAAYGFLESKSKADANFILNKLPKPIAGLGFAGNTALALYLIGYFTKNRIVKLGARGAAAVAAYQLARNQKLFAAGTDIPTLSGPHNGYGSGRPLPPEVESNRNHMIDDEDLGALDYEDEHDAASHT